MAEAARTTGAPGSRPPRIRLLSSAVVLLVFFLAFIVAPGPIRPALAQSAPADPAAARAAAAEAVPASPASPADPPRDVLHGAAANIARTTNGAGTRSSYRGLIEKEAAQNGLPPDVAEAVMYAESGYNP